MNSVILVLTPEEASHLHNMLWLLKGSQYPDNNWPDSVNTLEKKINSMAVKAVTKKLKQPAEIKNPQWPTDY